MKTTIPIPEHIRRTKASDEERANPPYRRRVEPFTHEGIDYYYDKYDDEAYLDMKLPPATREKIE